VKRGPRARRAASVSPTSSSMVKNSRERAADQLRSDVEKSG
jgi:hypothetical protein